MRFRNREEQRPDDEDCGCGEDDEERGDVLMAVGEAAICVGAGASRRGGRGRELAVTTGAYAEIIADEIASAAAIPAIAVASVGR